MGDFAGTIEDFTKLIELDPKNDDAYYYRGMAKKQLNDTAGALEDLKKAGELGNNYADQEIKIIQDPK